MSSRKQTIDGLDDVDDEDGALEQEISQETDLTLVVQTAEEVMTGSESSPEGQLTSEDMDDDGVDEEGA